MNVLACNLLVENCPDWLHFAYVCLVTATLLAAAVILAWLWK